MPWDPEQYHRFTQARFAPFSDLVALIRVRPDMTVVDLGCGTGELTVDLANRLPRSTILGVDESPQMLEKARSLGAKGVSFEQGDLQGVTGEYDLVFSHAVLHWIDDHPSLFPRLWSLVAPGGQIAFQIPSNHRHPSHTCVLAVADEEPFRSALGGWKRLSPVLEIDAYATLLDGLGAEAIVAMEKVYPVRLPCAADISEWTKGSTLVPWFDRLPETLHAPFVARYRELLSAALPPGPHFFTFRRILLAAAKPEDAA
ncbi:MAG TPA: methyltransferase domain-containing protein [Candidatus Deferrimicrobiaceae bacterium]|jgi:trans-aconitate 2-methyltransferase